MSRLRSRKAAVLILLALICCALLATTVLAASGSGKTALTVDCPDCGGTGVCFTCYGKDAACPDCGGTGVCATCGGTGQVAPTSGMYATFWALVPPIIAIGLALITKEVYSSLFIGIVVGGLFASNFSFTGTVDSVISDGLISAVSGNAGIFIFLILLGIMVALINRAGGSAAFGRWANRHIHSRIGALLATFAFGVLIFIDDYFNCLTVGSVMRPVTDSQRISRSKLAYLIDATAAPVCMIAPISSWAAAVSSYTEEGQGLSLFCRAIPFNFYSLFTFVFIIAITLMQFDYGLMRRHEENAMKNGDLFSGEKNLSAEEYEFSPNGRIWDLILPILVLIAACVFSLVYVGGVFEGSDFITAFSNTDASVALPWGGLVALVLTIVYLMLRRVVNFKDAMGCISKGFIAMVPAILILTMATSLKNMTAVLGAKVFVGNLMSNAAAGLNSLLPAIIFLVACGLSFATGTSWGTFGILIPIVTAIFPADNPLFIVGISACLAGAVCGDHCSPISDTTIMSSAGAQCYHMNHVSTQLPYAFTVAGISFVCYILAGFVPNAWLCLPVGAALTVGTLFIIRAAQRRKAA